MRHRLSGLLATSLFLACSGATAAAALTSHVVISQIYGAGGNSGATYANDFIVLYNPTAAPVSLTGWAVGYSSATGNFTQTTALSGSIAAGGYYLIKEASGGANGASLPAADATGTFNMSATTGKVGLATSAAALTGSCPSAGIVDLVGFGTANCFEGTGDAPAPASGAAGASKAMFRVNNADTNQNATDFAVQAVGPCNSIACYPTITQLSPNTAFSGGSAFTLTINGSNFGATATVNFGADPIAASNVTSSQVTATIPASDIQSQSTIAVTVASNGITSNSVNFSVVQPTCSETHNIGQIQGSGDASPFVSTHQTAQGIVTHKRSSGFFMQMAAPGDGDPTTSDGIYVFTSSAPTVSVGDLVCVTGAVDEYLAAASTDPNNSLTELDSPSIVTLSNGNALPAAVVLNPSPSGTFDQLERYEGMLVQISSLTVTGATGGTIDEPNGTATSSGAFYGVVTGTARPFREPGIDVSHPIAATLPPCCIPLFDSNPEVMEIYTGDPGVTKVDVADGAVITGISGVLDVYYGSYELDVDPSASLNVANNSLTYTAVPPALPSQLTIGTFNMERFYDTTDDPNTSDVVLTPAALNLRLTKASLAIRNVLQMPDILGVEEMENLANLQAVSAQISADAVAAGQPDPQYAAYLVPGNDIGGINVGFLVKPARVSNVTVQQFGKDTTFTDPNTQQQDILNDRPPLVLTGIAHNGASAPLPVTVIANHLKALPADDPTDPRVRVKRKSQADYLANLIQARQLANPYELIVSLGDYNAYEFNDGTADVIGTVEGTPAPANQVLVPSTGVVNPTLTELSTAYLPASARYTYTFNGSAQSLDHILVNPNVLSRIAQFSIGHLNADFPVIYRNDITRPERLSDHDPEVVYLSLPAASDVTSQTSVARSGLVYNRATGRYSGTVTVKNTSASTINGPLEVSFNGLASNVVLSDASGHMSGTGTPFITAGSSSLAPGASVSIAVQFQITGSGGVSYTNNVYSGSL
jgi:predicted extracellular nuclease